ncbi:hypothetical protein [Ancylobacter oerskovii]|uniref:DUF2721 domain-containing protein n=1 Tax=Ancylobacter oerskovii TaxID=459519 RepID=A0ABW4Z5S6_9HYPH|nr:hypothetical protein [Ancylobacter oerskovii]MBS7542449.1 hypothetical protein [Ancylobacter oerskovii]
MLEDPFASLSFIAGPAILTNASAILQNRATTRYNLAISHWRETRAALETDRHSLSIRYVNPTEALHLIRRRVWLQLKCLGLLNAAVALFAGTTLLGLAGALMLRIRNGPADLLMTGMFVSAGLGLAALLAATLALFIESASSGALLRLDREHGEAALRNTKIG